VASFFVHRHDSFPFRVSLEKKVKI
jgi:hypothetical protein